MLAAPPPTSYAAVMHRKRIMGDKAADDAARATAFSRSNRIKLSQILRQFPSAHDGRKISAVEKCVTDIDALPERCRGVEILFLSHNMICSLEHIYQFAHLRILSLTANPISDIEELRHLAPIATLQSVSFEDCDITLQPYYRSYVIKLLPQLRVLDSKEIKDAERDVAASIVSRCEETLQVMFTTHFLILKLSRVVTKIRLHSDLIGAVFGRISVLNRLDMATSWSISTKKLLQFWEVESLISPEEVAAVYRSLRSEIVRHRNILARKSSGPTPKNAFDVFKAITSDKTISKLSDNEMWDAAIKETMASQQGRVSILLGDIDQAKADAERSSSTIFKQVQRINTLREGQLKSEAAHKNDRENVIIELRQELERVSEGGPALPPHKSPHSSVKPARRPVMAERNSHMQLQNSVSRMNDGPKSAKKKQHYTLSPEDSTSARPPNPNTPFALRQLSPDFVIERAPPTEPRHSSSSSARVAVRRNMRSLSSKSGSGSRSGPSDDEEQPLTPPEMFSMQLPPTPPAPVSGGIDDSMGGGGNVSEGESVLPPPPQPLPIDGGGNLRAMVGQGAHSSGVGSWAKDGYRAKIERPPQLKPADSMEGLKQQVLLLQRDIDLRVEEEARLQDVIAEFTQRTLEMQALNNRNVDAAEAETQQLLQQLQEAKGSASAWEVRARDADGKLKHIMEGSGSSELQAFKIQEQQLELLRSENDALRSDVQKLAADSVKVHAQADEYSRELQRLWTSSAVADKADDLREVVTVRRSARAAFQRWSASAKLRVKGRKLQEKSQKRTSQLQQIMALFRLRCTQSRALVQVAARVNCAIKFRVMRLWCQLLAASKIGRVVCSRGAAAAAIRGWHSAVNKVAKTRALVQRNNAVILSHTKERTFGLWRALAFPASHAAPALAPRLQRAASHAAFAAKERSIRRWRVALSSLSARRSSPLILLIRRRSSLRCLAITFARWLQLRAITQRVEVLLGRLHSSTNSRKICLPVLKMWHRHACTPAAKVAAAVWFEKALALKTCNRCWNVWAAARVRGAAIRLAIENRGDITARSAILQWRSCAHVLARERVMEQKAVKHHAFRMIRTGIVVVKFWKKAVGRARFVCTMAGHCSQRHAAQLLLRCFLLWSRSWCRSLSTKLRDAAASRTEVAETLEQQVQRLSHADVENLELVDRLHQAASDNTALQRRVKEGEQAASDFRRALEDASIIEQSLRSELERTRITAGDVARRTISSDGGGIAAVSDSSHAGSRAAPGGEWSVLQASSFGRRQAPLSSSLDSRLAPPPLPPFFDNTFNTSSDSSLSHTPAPPLPRYTSPMPSFSGVGPSTRHTGGDTPTSALGWVRESASTPAFTAASAAAVATAAAASAVGSEAGQKELRNEIASLQSRILARLSNH